MKTEIYNDFAYELEEGETWEERRESLSSDWDDFKTEIQSLARPHMGFVLTGTTGTWHGTYNAGGICRTFREALRAFEDCDDMIVTDEDGHLFMEGIHHDGRNRFEVLFLTRAGYDFLYEEYDEAYVIGFRPMVDALFESGEYTEIPRFAERVYGVPAA